MQHDEPDIIRRARPCDACGHNLYTLPREGACPECGQPYKRRKHDATPKNPRRQLPQLRRLLGKRQRELRYIPILWAVTVLIVAGCYIFNAGCWWWGFAVAVVILTAGSHWGAVTDLHDAKEKIEAVDARPPDK